MSLKKVHKMTKPKQSLSSYAKSVNINRIKEDTEQLKQNTKIKPLL